MIIKIDNRFPDSQKEPFGKNQLAWLNEKYGNAHFRKATDGAMVKYRYGNEQEFYFQ